jgi:hypothetical protein
MGVLIFSTFISNISHYKKKWERYDRNVHWSSRKYSLFLSDFDETEFSRQIFEKSSNIKFHENLSSGSRVVPCGQTEMTKLIVALRSFANAPKKRKGAMARIVDE